MAGGRQIIQVARGEIEVMKLNKNEKITIQRKPIILVIRRKDKLLDDGMRMQTIIEKHN
jgi:hypothetical protein